MASSRAHKMAKGQYSTGGAVGRAMRTMRRHYADGGDVVKERAMFLPLGTYGDGTTRAAWPGLLYEPAAAWKRMMDSGYRPGDAESTRKMAEDSFTVAGAVPLAGLAAGAVRPSVALGRLVNNSGNRLYRELPSSIENAIVQRSSRVGYDPRPVPERSFYDDYPAAPRSNEKGRLEESIDGAKLNAPFVAGRRVLGGSDEGVKGGAAVDVARRLVEGNVREVPGTALPRGDVGRYRKAAGESGPVQEILYRDNLGEADVPRVIAHEAGHAIDELAANIPTDGIIKQLRQVYHDLATGQQGRTRHQTGPEHLGYATDTVPRELMAEAIRAYMTDPNYLKTVAPDVAKRIRQYVNENPRIARVIQFNTNPGTAAVAAGLQDRKE